MTINNLRDNVVTQLEKYNVGRRYRGSTIEFNTRRYEHDHKLSYRVQDLRDIVLGKAGADGRNYKWSDRFNSVDNWFRNYGDNLSKEELEQARDLVTISMKNNRYARNKYESKINDVFDNIKLVANDLNAREIERAGGRAYVDDKVLDEERREYEEERRIRARIKDNNIPRVIHFNGEEESEGVVNPYVLNIDRKDPFGRESRRYDSLLPTQGMVRRSQDKVRDGLVGRRPGRFVRGLRAAAAVLAFTVAVPGSMFVYFGMKDHYNPLFQNIRHSVKDVRHSFENIIVDDDKPKTFEQRLEEDSLARAERR